MSQSLVRRPCRRGSRTLGLCLVLLLVSRGGLGAEAHPPPAAPPSAAAAQAQEQQALARWDAQLRAVRRAETVLRHRREQAGSDAEFLEATLSLLQVPGRWQQALRDADPRQLLESLAARPWRLPPDLAPEAFLVQLAAEAARNPAPADDELRRCAEEFRRLGPEPWPLTWRARQEFWLGLVARMLQTKRSPDTSPLWRAAIAAAPEQADLLRMAYLLAVRHAPEARLEVAVVEPLYGRDRPLLDRIGWRAETLTTLLGTRVGPQDPHRATVGTELFDLLRERTRSGGPFALGPVCDPLATLYRRAEGEPEQGRLVATLVTYQSPEFFRLLADRAGLPATQQIASFLAKPVALPRGPKSLAECLDQLTREVALGVWIDGVVVHTDALLPADAQAGPWLEVVESILRGTDYRLHLLGPGLFWIGRPDGLRAAQTLYQDGLSRLARAEGRLVTALREDAELGFVGTPLADVATFLRDRHNVPLHLLAQERTDVTITVRRVPLHVALTLLTRKLDSDWCAAGEAVLIGTRAQLEQVRALEFERLRRWSRLGLAAPKIARVLVTEPQLAFEDYPAAAAGELLADQLQVAILVSPAVRERPLTLDVKQLAFERVLDLLPLTAGVAWDTDGEVLLLGSEGEVAGYRQLAATRTQRRTTYPAAVRKKLCAPVPATASGSSLAELFAQLAQAGQVNIAVESDARAISLTKVWLKLPAVPLDSLLDSLSVAYGFRWEPRDRGAAILPPP